VTLHPDFRNRESRRVLRRLIADWLLPRYNVLDALQIAWLMRGRTRGFHPAWPAVLYLALACLLSIIVWPWLPQSCAGAALIAGPTLGMIVLALFCFDLQSLFDIMLPRIIGGGLLGYLTLLFSDGAWDALALFLPSPAPPSNAGWLDWPASLLALWGICTLVAAGYLWREAIGSISHGWRAFRRVLAVLAWAILVIFGLGFLVTGIATPLDDPEIDLAHVYRTFLGVISVYAIATFAPIALLVGIGTQLIWQREVVTTSIWEPESD
jgi:hypothetical protein